MSALLSEVLSLIVYLTLNRPQAHNSLNPELAVQLGEAWQEVKEDDGIRAAIITGAGEEAFSAGADLGRLIPLTTRARQLEDEWDRKLLANLHLHEQALLREFDLWKPVIAGQWVLYRRRDGIDAGDQPANRGGTCEPRSARGQICADSCGRLDRTAAAPDSLLSGDGDSAHG
jgi:hypothetical protein